MKGRERILAAFAGEAPDAVPFAPNVYQWFYNHQREGTLPAELAQARHPIDVLRSLGADILVRWDTQRATRAIYAHGDYREEYLGSIPTTVPVTTAFNVYPSGRDTCRRSIATPYGTLSETWVYSRDSGADFCTEFLWKRWDEYAAVRYLLESREYVLDHDLFLYWDRLIGDDGLPMVHLTQTPLKTFHWLAGQQNATLFMVDHPDEMKALATIHVERVLRLLHGVVEKPFARVFISLDNLDVMFYSPALYRLFCADFFAQLADVIHSHGKYLVVHACGKNRRLLPLVGASHVDCLEGITPPPFGDVLLPEARALSGYAGFTVNGGIDLAMQELQEDAAARIHDYTRSLFAGMGNKRHFIFASSCNTSPLTPWSNLIHFRDAAREYGEL